MNTLRNHLALILAASAFTLAGCSKSNPAPAAPAVVTGLAVAQAHVEQVPITVDAVGTVHAKESAALASQVMGRVLSVGVREGDSVRAGQLLVALDDAQARAQVEQAHAAVVSSEHEVQVAATQASLAQSTLARYQLLRDRKSVSPQEFDEVNRRSQVSAAQLESARSQMLAAKATEAGARSMAGYTRIHAPFAGIVTARHVDPGAMATPGMLLVEVEKAGALQLQATIDESLIRSLQKGMSVPVEINALSAQPLNARVAEIVPAADPASHSFMVKFDLPATAGLRSGMFGTAKIGSGSQSVLLLPQDALVTHGSMNGVWVLDANSIASMRYVTLGAKQGANMVVLSGISAGETVVLSSGDRELGGKRIEVRR